MAAGKDAPTAEVPVAMGDLDAVPRVQRIRRSRGGGRGRWRCSSARCRGCRAASPRGVKLEEAQLSGEIVQLGGHGFQLVIRREALRVVGRGVLRVAHVDEADGRQDK
jgi:hypothetical protein